MDRKGGKLSKRADQPWQFTIACLPEGEYPEIDPSVPPLPLAVEPRPCIAILLAGKAGMQLKRAILLIGCISKCDDRRFRLMGRRRIG
jgi:hypothetical protein